MRKKKKRIKKRNGIAKALESPSFKHRVIPDKRNKKSKHKKKEHCEDFLKEEGWITFSHWTIEGN